MTVKGRHLTLEERHFIEDALTDELSLSSIAKHLGKDPTTISKEIRRNRIIHSKGKQIGYITCDNLKECTHRNICPSNYDQLCRRCKLKNCFKICSLYQEKSCIKVKRYPHVCNGCRQKVSCKLQKYRYQAKVAQAMYEEELISSREGISLRKAELLNLDALISPLILKGQSIAHIYAHHKHEIKCSKRTLYIYFEQNLFVARNIDLPRKVKYQPRKKNKGTTSRLPTHRIKRSYSDFGEFILKHPNKHIVEMDTVHGCKGSKSLLTFFFRNSSLMLIFLLDACTQDAVNAVFDSLYLKLGKDVFNQTFPIILTDNGSEFKAPTLLEFDDNNARRTHLFYCDPMASHQKGCIEKNHEFIRYILPKGKSFNDLTQEKVTLMTNHINSIARASLNDCTPFKLAQMILNDKLLKACDLQLIPADDVHLKPMLLK